VVHWTSVPEAQVDSIRDSAPIHVGPSWNRLWASFFNPAVAPLVSPRADLGRLRSDAVAIHWDKRHLYLLKVTRPYDSRLDFSKRTDHLKMTWYRAVVDRFNAIAPRWQVQIVPFTMDIRGTFDEDVWTRRLAELDIAQADIPRLIDKVVAVKLSALDIVYDARCTALREDQLSAWL